MAKPKLQPHEWEAIKQEYIAGQRDLTEIARQYGITDALIHITAKRKGWPPRNPREEVVSRIVRRVDESVSPANNLRLALTTFQRCIELLHRHRSYLAMLMAGILTDMKALETMREKRATAGRAFTLDELRIMAEIHAKMANALARLIPLERRAFGIGPDDMPSEFDGLTPDELALIIETVRRATQA